jgi:glycosyltransferase involved in cell wall biosynthesis
MIPTRPRLLRITTVPISLHLLLRGQPSFFQARGFEVLTVSADGPEVADLKREQVNHQVVNMTRKITPLKDFFSLLHLIAIIRKYKPQIVHTHTPKAGLLGMMAAFICRVPIRMHTVAGLPLIETRGLKKQILIMAEQLTYACATAVYANSIGLKHYIERKISRNPILIIGKGSTNGIDSARFKRTTDLESAAKEIRKKYQFGSQDLVLSFAGRIVRDKGIGEMIRAFKILSESFDQGSGRLKLLLIGPFEKTLDPLTPAEYHYLESNSNIVLTGFQSDIRPWIMASDIFVFPSYREGFPNVVMQACCLEVPCIVSDINGCNEIIQHDLTGLVVKPKHVDELTNALKILIQDPQKRKTFATHARKFVQENFDQQQIWNELLEQYLLALGRLK